MYHPGLRFTLSDLAGSVLVAAMTLAPISAGINAVGEASYMAAVGIFGVAALPRRSRDRTFRLAFAASGSSFLLVSGWFFIPVVSGQPDFGRVLQAAWAIAVGILGGLLTRRLTTTAGGGTDRVSTAASG